MDKTINHMTRIIEALDSNQVLVYISDSNVSPRISDRCIVLRDKSINALEEVVMALGDYRVQLVVYTDDNEFIELVRAVVSYSSSMIRPITVGEFTRREVVYSVTNDTNFISRDRLDYILIARLYQIVGSIGLLPRFAKNRIPIVCELPLEEKVGVISTIDFILGISDNSLKDFRIKELAYILSMLLISTDIEYILEKLSYLREDAEYVI